MSRIDPLRSQISSRLTWTSLPYLLVALAVVIYAGYFIIYGHYALSLFRFPFDYDQGEGFELMDTVLFSQGQWPYRDNDSYPFYSSNYPPLYHLAVVPLVWLFGPQYWTGRLVAFVGTLITSAAIGYAVQREGKRWWLSLLAALAFLASNYVYHVGPLFRQHMFMVMFETLAVVLLTVVIDREERSGRTNNKGLLVVMLLLLFAGYTKQLAYATVMAVFLFLFLRQTRRAILWAIPFAAVTSLIFLLINIATDGHWLTNTVTANVNPYIPAQGIGLFRQWFQLHIVITVAAVALAAYQLYFERLSAYAIWFLIAAGNGLTAGKWGAGESYFATAIAGSCILAGLLFGRGLDWSRKRSTLAHAATLALVATLFIVQADKLFHMPTDSTVTRTVAAALGKPVQTEIALQTSCSDPQPPITVPYVDSAGVGLVGRPPSRRDREAGLEIAEHVRQGSTAAFSEEAGFNFRAGRDIVTNPTQLLNLYNNNQVDLTEMIDMLDRQQFDTVIYRAQFYPPPILEIIGQRYQTTKLVEMNGFVYCILEPAT